VTLSFPVDRHKEKSGFSLADRIRAPIAEGFAYERDPESS
jgi:hypothetical protein